MNHKNEVTRWSRKCPKCGGLVYHQSKQDRDRREREGRTCGGKANLNCKLISKAQRKKLSEANMGQIQPWAGKRRRNKLTKSKWNRSCPQCNRAIYYSDKEHLKDGIRRNSVCTKCHNFKWGCTWKGTINPNHIKKMRATKAGFKSWKEYLQKYPKWKQYKAEVWRLTYANLRKNPPLENFDKRGLCGVSGAYQIDHNISVRLGFDRNIHPMVIAEYNNLRMIPWRDNLRKG